MGAQELNYKTFFQSVRSGDIGPCYLFDGEEAWIKRSALDQLTQTVIGDQFPEMNCMVLKNPETDELIAAAETLPFMSDRRLIIVRECALVQSGKNKDAESNTDDADKMLDYLRNMSPQTVIVFYCEGNADGKRKLVKYIESRKGHVRFDHLSEDELTKWIAREFSKMGKRITRENCERMQFMCGRDLYHLSTEMEKLAAWCDEREAVEAEDIKACCHPEVEYSVFEMTNALFAGEAGKAFSILRDLLQGGESRLGLLALVSSQCRRFYSVALMKKAGLSEGQMASNCALPPFAIRETARQAKSFTDEQLEKMNALCLETEFRVKSGDINENGSLEYVMLEILHACKGGKILVDR